MLTPPIRAMRYPTAKKFAILASMEIHVNGKRLTVNGKIRLCGVPGLFDLPFMFTVHRSSALALLVARILADHPHHPLAADDLAVAADSLDRCQHFHT